jgi:hypothetical protein
LLILIVYSAKHYYENENGERQSLKVEKIFMVEKRKKGRTSIHKAIFNPGLSINLVFDFVAFLLAGSTIGMAPWGTSPSFYRS